jgi:glyoxylase-like metal-dependent hydrolase (beta-lactamase superfamily II)
MPSASPTATHPRLQLIVLTHSHPDHIGAARAIQEATGCSIAAHPAERAWIEDVERQNRERPVSVFASLVGGPVQLDHELAYGDGIEPDDTRAIDLQVLHTPGHSPGSISLWMQSEGAVFSGDTIPVTGDLPVYDDAPVSVRSLLRLRGLGGTRVLLSAWDEPRKGGDVYIQMDRAVEYLQKIHEAVRSGSGTADLLELTKQTAAATGLPSQAVNPLLARTITANLRERGRENPTDSFLINPRPGPAPARQSSKKGPEYILNLRLPPACIDHCRSFWRGGPQKYPAGFSLFVLFFFCKIFRPVVL